MEKSSGSDWGESRQRRQRGMKLRWVSLLPAKTNLYFLLYGLWFCSSGWVSDLTEWYQTRNRLLKAFRLLRKVSARQLCVSQESVQNFLKLLELNILVFLRAFPYQSLRREIRGSWRLLNRPACDVCWHVYKILMHYRWSVVSGLINAGFWSKKVFVDSFGWG